MPVIIDRQRSRVHICGKCDFLQGQSYGYDLYLLGKDEK